MRIGEIHRRHSQNLITSCFPGPVFATENGVGKPQKPVKVAPLAMAAKFPARHLRSSRRKRLTQRGLAVDRRCYCFIRPGTIFSGGLAPGGLIERMKAMRSSEVLTANPIGGMGACTL